MKPGGTQPHTGARSGPYSPLDRSVRADAEHGHATNSMSADAAQEFVDTNVLIYAFDASAGAKQASARQLLERLWDTGTGCLSVQVLQEFFVTTTRKVAHPLPVDEATERVREFATWKVFAPTANDVLAAIALQKQAQLSFWDAMMVQAAAELGCDVLWTEDMNNGQLLRGVRVRNPFES
jgi:predicted nucleic acid-binding protein